MKDYNLSKSQIAKLEKFYGVPLEDLVVEEDGLITGGSKKYNVENTIVVNDKRITVPKSQLPYWHYLREHIAVGGRLHFTKCPESKDFVKLMGGDTFLIGFNKGIWYFKSIPYLEGSGWFGDAWNKVKNVATDALQSIGLSTASGVYNKNAAVQAGEPVVNSPRVPDLKTCFQFENASYNPEVQPEFDSWKPILRTKYLACYKNEQTKTILCALRGTDPKDTGDLVADIGIALGSLKVSARYKSDRSGIIALQKAYTQNEWWYIGVGHSLGGAILDELLKEGLLKEGVSFNPAVSKEDYNKPTTNRRIYLSTDPLYNLMGKYCKYKEVRQSSKMPLAAHDLSNFEGGSAPEGLELHAVVIKKPIGLEDARRISQDYIRDSKKTFVRETGSSFRFRKYPKQRFDPKSFITKKQRDCSLIFGKFVK